MYIERTGHDDVLNRIIDRMNEQHITQAQLTRSIGMNRSVFNEWKKKNGSRSYLKYIDKIADCLGVSCVYLLNGSSPMEEDKLTAEEKELVRRFRTMNSDRKMLMEVISAVLEGE